MTTTLDSAPQGCYSKTGFLYFFLDSVIADYSWSSLKDAPIHAGFVLIIFENVKSVNAWM